MKTMKFAWLLAASAVLFVGCGGGDEDSSSATTPTTPEAAAEPAETTPEPPPPVPVKEKIVGGWTAAVSFDNENFGKIREELGDEEKVNKLDEIVENLMGTTFQMVFAEDGTMKASKPGGDKDQKAPGTYTIENDENTSATINFKLETPGGEVEQVLEATFEDDDNFKAPWNYEVPEEAKDVFHIKVYRDKFAK